MPILVMTKFNFRPSTLNPWRACAGGFCGRPVCVCVSVKSHLTSGASVYFCMLTLFCYVYPSQLNRRHANIINYSGEGFALSALVIV